MGNDLPSSRRGTRTARSLTQRTLESLLPESVPYRVPDSRCAGLAARVATNGVITWDLAFRIKGGKGRRISLGRFPEVSLESARNGANELTRAGRSGHDLISERLAFRVAQAQRITVSGLIEQYIKAKDRSGLRTISEMKSRLVRSLATILLLPADTIRRRQIGEMLDAVAESGRDREAEKRRQVIGAMFRWAISKDIVEIDPTRGLTAYDPGTPRDRVLTSHEMRLLFSWLPTSGIPRDHADVLRIELALGARCGEIAGMQATEIDKEMWTWTLPAARSKNRRARVTPLVGISRDIVAGRLPAGGALFRSETGKPLRASHVGQVLLSRRSTCPIAHFTTHDLRRTFVSALVDFGHSIEVVAALVGHDGGERQTRTLMRHYVKTDMIERKRCALLSWDRELKVIVHGDTAINEQGH